MKVVLYDSLLRILKNTNMIGIHGLYDINWRILGLTSISRNSFSLSIIIFDG